LPKRKHRIRVVLDTNVLIRHFISHARDRKHGFNRRVFELWFIKGQIQLVVSSEIVEEYIVTLELVLGIADDILKGWQSRFFSHNADVVSPGKRYAFSRDSKDNVFLTIAAVGKADFLITNDRDLLDISAEDKRKLKFQIVTPAQFLKQWDALQ
jgi:putative PIN family toxin of toxin-antitoxin system